MFAGATIAVLSTVLFASPPTEDWHGLLPETPSSLSTLREGWIDSYRERLEKFLYAFTLTYELNPTDEELCRQEIYSLWVAEAQHYSDSFANLERLRSAMEPDGDGRTNPEAEKAYREAFFGMRDNAPLARENLLASLERVLSPGDYSIQRQRFIELMYLFEQRAFSETGDRVRMSSSGRQVRGHRRACTAKLSESGSPMPHRVWIAKQRVNSEKDVLSPRSHVVRRRLAKSQAGCCPGGGAVHRIPVSHDSDGVQGKGGGTELWAMSAHHPVLSEWTGLVADASNNDVADQKRRAHLMVLKDRFQRRLDAYIASRLGEYVQVEETTQWDEYQRLHEHLDAPLAAMTEELRLRLDRFEAESRPD